MLGKIGVDGIGVVNPVLGIPGGPGGTDITDTGNGIVVLTTFKLRITLAIASAKASAMSSMASGNSPSVLVNTPLTIAVFTNRWRRPGTLGVPGSSPRNNSCRIACLINVLNGSVDGILHYFFSGFSGTDSNPFSSRAILKASAMA